MAAQAPVLCLSQLVLLTSFGKGLGLKLAGQPHSCPRERGPATPKTLANVPISLLSSASLSPGAVQAGLPGSLEMNAPPLSLATESKRLA